MKFIPSFLFILFLLPNCMGQDKLELYFSPSLSNAMGLGQDYDKSFGWHSGMLFLKPTKKSAVEFIYGIQASQFSMTNKIGLRWGTQHDGQGGFTESKESFLKNKYNFYYIETPIGVRQNFSLNKVNFYAQSSLAPSVFIAQYHFRELQSEIGVTNTQKTFDREQHSNLNMHWNASVGGTIHISNKFALNIAPSYTIQLFQSKNEIDDSARYHSFGLWMGAQFVL